MASEDMRNTEDAQAATHADDPVFVEEQAHLAQTFEQLGELKGIISARLAANLKEVQEFKENSGDELSTDIDRDGADVSMETYAAYAMMNNVVDSFNIAIDTDAENLRRVEQLLPKPYFAKVSLLFPHKSKTRDIYLGSVGVTDDAHHQLVVDWRSPVAETYYNQQTGPMTYEANGRTVHVDLKLRRQFDVDHGTLNSYFDTTVAIQDPMLLASLAARRGAQMQAITATIQKEQNAVIRHADVPVLLVRGVAGSGKTSVMLQRIAYLLYQQRTTLNADQVYLISPNPVFARYIENVLPELGEKNPHTMLWSELMEKIGPGDRGLGAEVDPATLRAIDEGVGRLALSEDDMCAVRAGERDVFSAHQIWRVVEKYLPRVGVGPRLCAMVEEELLDKLDGRIGNLAHDEDVRDDMLQLDEDEMTRIFGHVIDTVDEEELDDYARTYAEDLCTPGVEQIERAGWLRLDRIGMRMLGKKDLSGTEWVYLKLALTGKDDPAAKFVMIDEAQDYTAGQLMVLARYFSRAHFMLLGDPNQAIRPGTASFEGMARLFADARGVVDECELMTSYRSSPEITALFASLAPKDDQMKISSVQRPGTAPRIIACAEADEYRDQLVRLLDESAGEEGLTAVVVNTKKRVRWLSGVLEEAMGERAPRVIREGMALPDAGSVLIDLTLAKGLEFDRVIIADAQASEFPDEPLARRRLYTAISRATKRVTIVAQGELTPLLAGAAGLAGE